MRFRYLIFSVAALFIFTLTLRNTRECSSKVSEYDEQVEKFEGFQLAIDKTFSADSVVDGQSELLAKVSEFESAKSDKSRIIAELQEDIKARFIDSGHELHVMPIQKPKVKRAGLHLSENLYLLNGLNYRLSESVALGVQLENVLAWLPMDEKKEESFFTSLNSGKEATVLFTLTFNF